MYCLKFPKKEAILRLNRFDMRSTILYFFTLMFVMILPLEIKLLFDNYPSNDVPESIYVVQVIILYPISMIFFGLLGMSFLTGSALFVSKILKKRVKMQLLWKLITFSLTKPILAYTLANVFIGNNKIVNLIVFTMIIYYIIKMIIVFPKRSN